MPPPPVAPPRTGTKRLAAREVIDVLHEMSALLNTHLDRSQLSLCVSLLENGINPEALAAIVKELHDEGDRRRVTRLESEYGQ